jgi:nucleotide-binding universal stress UspA family protein
MYSRIAVALDPSEHTRRILEFASGLLRPGSGRLDLVQVHEQVRPGEELEALPIYGWEQIVEYDDGIDENSLREETWRLHELAARVLQETGVQAEVHVLRGSPAETLVGYARATRPDLFVAATRPNHWRSERTAGLLVRRSGAPVLLLRGAVVPEPVRMRRILVPLDGSDFSASILAPVIDLARATGADVTLLRCPTDRMRSVLFHDSAAEDRDQLERLREAFPYDLAPPTLCRPVHSDPAGAILREAQADYDLIAMATHGWGSAWNWCVGSTAGKVMAVSHLPVLAYHPAAVHAATGALALAH